MAYMRPPASDVVYVPDDDVEAYRQAGYSDATDEHLAAWAASDIYGGHQGVPHAPVLLHHGYDTRDPMSIPSNREAGPAQSQAVERHTQLINSPADQPGPYHEMGLTDIDTRDRFTTGRDATKAEQRREAKAAEAEAEVPEAPPKRSRK